MWGTGPLQHGVHSQSLKMWAIPFFSGLWCLADTVGPIRGEKVLWEVGGNCKNVTAKIRGPHCHHIPASAKSQAMVGSQSPFPIRGDPHLGGGRYPSFLSFPVSPLSVPAHHWDEAGSIGKASITGRSLPGFGDNCSHGYYRQVCSPPSL